MPLPILESRHEPSAADLLRLFHRTEAMWVGHLAEGETLDVGTAYTNPALANVWDANNVRDVSLAGAEITPGRAVEIVDAHFSTKGCRCAYWTMNPSAPDAQTKPMVDHLLATGHLRLAADVLRLGRIAPPPAVPFPGVTVIPARASYRHARLLAEERSNEHSDGNADYVEALMLDVDNPQFDALLALQGDRPVATLGVQSVGDVGRIEDVYVAKDFRRQGLGRMMMNRALEICARSLFKHVFILVAQDNAPAQGLYRSLGFEPLGELVSYRAPWLARPPA